MSFDVRKFQQDPLTHDWTGDRLLVDGNLGPKTHWAVAVQDLPRQRREGLRLLCHQRGIFETSPNRGPRVDEYVAPAGIGLGHPWCACLQCWVARESGYPVPRYTASAAVLLNQYPLIDASQAVPYDLYGWVHADGTGHVGRYLADGDVAGTIVGLEGNTSNACALRGRLARQMQFRSVGPGVWGPNAPKIAGYPARLIADGSTR